MTTFSAASIQDAVELAERLRDDGRYDLFRGQREDWPVKSSLARLAARDMKTAEERMKLFFSWIDSSPELAELANREDRQIVDQKFAVAQHYGLATTFCDFTTEPSIAGFFASSEHVVETSARSVIVCCNSDELMEWCRDNCAATEPQPELLRLSVPNLWRIQAQCGVFLFLPYQDFEEKYRFDRIEFPAGRYDAVDVRQVYPERRSELEVLLDQYFRFEVDYERDAAIRAREDLWKIANPDAAAMMTEVLIDGDPGPHSSWTNADERWSSYSHQTWVPDSETMQVDSGADFSQPPDRVRKAVLERIHSVLAAEPAVRSAPSSLVSNDPAYAGVINKLQLLWDGLRGLPYSDDDLAVAMSNCAFLAALLLESFKTGKKTQGWRHVAEALLENPEMVEFGRRGSAAAAGYADEDALVRASRPDLAALFKSEYANLPERGGTIIQVIQVPSRAFVFDKFASVFATQVAPTQVMLFASKAHYFNPLRLGQFGLP